MYVNEYDNNYKYKLHYISNIHTDKIFYTAYINRYSYTLIFYYYYFSQLKIKYFNKNKQTNLRT